MKTLRSLRLERDEKDNPLKIRRVKKIFKKLFPWTLVIGVFMALAIFLTTFSGTSSYVTSIISGTSLKSSEGRVNILFLGIAGGRHDGSNLTDTIMVVSYNLKTNEVDLISIPRDLWLPFTQGKVNAVYQKGLSEGDGLDLAKTVIGNILDIPIHYALRLDFRGFVQTIDAIDGIDMLVEKPFDDYLYPIEGKENDLCGLEEKEMEFNSEEAKKLNIEPGKKKVLIDKEGKIATDAAEEDKGIGYFSCRYERISFKEGGMRMNGAVALSFVRSRHGTNNEGSDFARSKRQQKVLEAVKSKILSLETLANLQRIGDLIKTLGKSIDTDVPIKDTLEFYKLAGKVKQTRSFILDDSPKVGLPDNKLSLLVSPPRGTYGGAYVLISEDDDFSYVHGYVRKILTGEITEYDATAAARVRN